MAAERSTAVGSETANDVDSTPAISLGHLSLLPLAGAAAAVVTGTAWSWPVAAMLLAVAYLAVYVRLRRVDR